MALSKTMIRGLGAAAAAAVLAVAGAADAAVTWNITGVFNDGGTLSGTITLNVYDFLQKDFTLTTTAGSLESGFTYTASDSYFSNTNPSYAPKPIYIDFEPQYQSDLHIQFANDLGVAAPVDKIVGGLGGPSFECIHSWSCPGPGMPGYAVRYLVSGQATLVGGPVAGPPGLGAAVPEPATWAFLVLGVGAVGSALRLGLRQRATA